MRCSCSNAWLEAIPVVTRASLKLDERDFPWNSAFTLEILSCRSFLSRIIADAGRITTKLCAVFEPGTLIGEVTVEGRFLLLLLVFWALAERVYGSGAGFVLVTPRMLERGL